MTSHSHSAAIGVSRRPAPPRSAASVRAFASPVTYTPEEYDPRHAPAAHVVKPGQFGLVHPRRRTGGAAWLVLLLIVAGVGGFLGWRVVHTGAAPAPGVPYTSAAGHFSARFPAQPVELSRSERDGATRLVMNLAVVAGQGSVMSLEIRGPVTSDVQRLARRMADRVGSHGITLSSVQHFTFHGMKAMQGNFIQSSTGELATVLVAAESKRRMYLVFGLTGPTFDELKESFAVAG